MASLPQKTKQNAAHRMGIQKMFGTKQKKKNQKMFGE